MPKTLVFNYEHGRELNVSLRFIYIFVKIVCVQPFVLPKPVKHPDWEVCAQSSWGQ